MEISIALYETLLTCEKIPKKVLSIDKIDSDGIFFCKYVLLLFWEMY